MGGELEILLSDKKPNKKGDSGRGTAFLSFARHGHNLTGESPERAPIAGSA